MQRFLLLLILISSLQVYTSRCCLQQERAALLDLKSHLMSLSISVSESSREYLAGELSSWRNNSDDNCCTWERVKCNGSMQVMQHVTELSLDGALQYQDISNNYILNVSLFEPFKELISLNLSDNSICGLVGHKGENMLNLRNLEIFDFRNNSMYRRGELEGLVGLLTSLKKLILSENGLDQSFATKELVKLKHLQVLEMTSTFSDMIGLYPALAELKELQVLDLSWNDIVDPLSEEGGLCDLQNLQELYLKMTYITGNIPQCFGNLTSLRILDISYNNLSGSLAPIIPNLKSLECVSVSDNLFTGEISLNSFSNHSNLEILILSNNPLRVKVDDSLIYSNKFQPQILGLSNCNLNIQSISFLKFLSSMRNLQILDISHNGLVRSFPTWLLHNNSNIEAIMLRNNSFEGVVSLPKLANLSLLALDISDNHFFGIFPDNLGTILPNLRFLNASMNTFEGSLPTSLANMTTLEVLELSNNNFSGLVPKQMYTYCPSIRYLRLSNNNFHGEILPRNMSLTQLKVLHLDGNHFIGSIEDKLLKSNSQLLFFDISNNEVTGSIPSWISNFSSLSVLSMSGNQLKGEIPIELCNINYLNYLDLSDNGLTGVIPSCYINNTQLFGLQLRNNFLSGSIPNSLIGDSQLNTLDLSGNQLSGNIPAWIGNLTGLYILILGRNSLEGEIPKTLCQLQVSIMDLSSNEIYGGIPTCLKNMTFGLFSVEEEVVSYNEGDTFAPFGISSKWYWPGGAIDGSINQEVETLLTKSRYDHYKGYILDSMSLLDLSCNKLTGKIPKELGQMTQLHALNLSHNRLSGSIPSTFSMLKSIESLDLSYNNLSGEISSQIAEVTSLEIFNVSYNNLSGMVPQTGQFASFDENNYKGNPFLCGFVGKSCTKASMDVFLDGEEEDDGSTGGFDWQVFFWSFGMCSITLFFASIVILVISPRWCNAWFLFVDLHVLWWLYK